MLKDSPFLFHLLVIRSKVSVWCDRPRANGRQRRASLTARCTCGGSSSTRLIL